MDRAKQPSPTHRLFSNEPLWKRAPSRAEDGEPVADFMMLIPGLKQQTPQIQKDHADAIQRALTPFGDNVVFADLNIRLNLLWISHRTQHGLSLHIVNAVQDHIPNARLVANQFEMTVSELNRPWFTRIKRRLLLQSGSVIRRLCP